MQAGSKEVLFHEVIHVVLESPVLLLQHPPGVIPTRRAEAVWWSKM